MWLNPQFPIIMQSKYYAKHLRKTVSGSTD